MTRHDLLMIKGVRRIVEDCRWHRVDVYLSPWWSWSKKRRAMVDKTLSNRMACHVLYRLKTHWY